MDDASETVEVTACGQTYRRWVDVKITAARDGLGWRYCEMTAAEDVEVSSIQIHPPNH